MTMPSSELATCSQASIASSRRSKMSFQRMTTSGSMPLSNSDAVALLLADHDVARQVGAVGVVREHLVEQVGAADDVGGGLLEEVEEHTVLAGENLGQAGHPRRSLAGENDVKDRGQRSRERMKAAISRP